jgi:hypothetical protein
MGGLTPMENQEVASSYPRSSAFIGGWIRAVTTQNIGRAEGAASPQWLPGNYYRWLTFSSR